MAIQTTLRNNPMRRQNFKMILSRSAGVFILSFALWLSIEFFAPSWLQASIPVIDSAAITQMVQQYMQMVRQVEALYQQVALLKAQIQTATGHYGMGALGRAVNSWGATTWSDIANMVGRGINPGDADQVRAYKEAQSRYVDEFPALSHGLRTTNPRMGAAYSHSYSDAMTGIGLGEGTFNRVNTYLADIQILKDKIEQTDNLKSAVDLNTAVNVRIAQVNGEILRLQAAQLRLQAANKNDAANGYAAQAEFFGE